METMASNFPGAFSGYGLRVVESHQSSKKDTSGTAKAVVRSFQARRGLGSPLGPHTAICWEGPGRVWDQSSLPLDCQRVVLHVAMSLRR